MAYTNVPVIIGCVTAREDHRDDVISKIIITPNDLQL